MNFSKSSFKDYYRIIAGCLSIMVVTSCTEELSIADFADDFKNYESELRIEAVLDIVDFSKSVVRVDHTILVTDTALFNGIDDNGDWESYTDLNANGRWDENEPLNDDVGVSIDGPGDEFEGRGDGQPTPGEPHIDDYIEILPQVHDSTMVSVVLREAISQNMVAEFIWNSRAASFDQKFGADGPPTKNDDDIYITYFYGAYVPSGEYSALSLDASLDYQLELTTSAGRVIAATTNLVGPPINLSWENTFWEADTLVNVSNNYAMLLWNNSSETSYCSVIMDEILGPDSALGVYASMAVAINRDADTNLLEFQGNFIGVPLGLYRLRLESYTENYGNYVYSGLPLRDRELSNWRDQDGNVVIGVLGAKTPIELYIRMVSPAREG